MRAVYHCIKRTEIDFEKGSLWGSEFGGFILSGGVWCCHGTTAEVPHNCVLFGVVRSSSAGFLSK